MGLSLWMGPHPPPRPGRPASLWIQCRSDRITLKFLTMILENFRRDHTIREKYNVVTRSSETHIGVGYAQNVDGFGWTNGVFLELWHESPPEVIAQIRKD